MTKKNFERVAEIIRYHKINSPYLIVDLRRIANDLAKYFKEENPEFNRSRFLQACGWYDE